MRAAAILGLGCSPKDLKPFQSDKNSDSAGAVDWQLGMPAAADEADVVLLFGGDGTIHRHLSQFVKLGLPVLVVPAGSGNDFARALGLCGVRDSLAAWQKYRDGGANVRTIDLGVITPLEGASSSPPNEPAHNSVLDTQRYFCCVAGVGLDGEVARRANELPRWLRGHGGYVLSLVPALVRFAALTVKIQTMENEGEINSGWVTRSEKPTILAAFANTPVYGGGMQIAPQAHMQDGKLDACLVGDISKFKLFCLFPTVYFGRHLGIPAVDYFQASRMRVETETPLDVYADGEYVCSTPVEVTAAGGALRVVVP
jgi:diacylglycerol kinase (ATP)